MTAAFDDIESLIIRSDSFDYAGSRYQVWGLTAAHITFIVRKHGSALAPLYVDATAGNLPADLNEIAESIGSQFVEIAGVVIACGARRPDLADRLAELPLATQIIAMDKIIRLTLEGEGGLGKVVEIITRAAAGMAALQRRGV